MLEVLGLTSMYEECGDLALWMEGEARRFFGE